MEYPYRETDLVATSWFRDIAEIPQIKRRENELWFANFIEELKEKEQDPLKVKLAQVSADIGSTTHSTILTLGQKLQDTEFLFSPRICGQHFTPHMDDDHSDQSSFNDFIELYLHPPGIPLSQRDVTRWKSASRAAQAFGKDGDHENHLHMTAYIFWDFSVRCEDWPNLDDVLDAPFLQLGFVLAALVYGGLHALAWFAHFNTSTEQLLWRVSACIVMGGLPVVFGLFALIRPLKILVVGWSGVSWHDFKIYGFKDSIMEIYSKDSLGNWAKLGIWILFRLLYLVGIVYALARAYLVVECFICLAHLPAGVYDVPQWAAYFPNIS